MESQHQNISETQITEIQDKPSETFQNHKLKQKININQKMNQLYQGEIFLPNTSYKYINLSPIKLTETKQEFFKSSNYHLSRKYDVNIKNRN